MTLSKATQKFLGLNEFSSNQEIIKSIISKYPGLRFHEIKKETKLANGTLQHHLKFLTKQKIFKVRYVNKIPRYYIYNINDDMQVILLRLRQYTASKIIKSLLKYDCLIFSDIVKYVKRSPGTVSVYKNMLLADKIIIGNTDNCENCQNQQNKIKYRLVAPEYVKTLVNEYGKSSLKKCADNLTDVFLSLK